METVADGAELCIGCFSLDAQRISLRAAIGLTFLPLSFVIFTSCRGIKASISELLCP